MEGYKPITGYSCFLVNIHGSVYSKPRKGTHGGFLTSTIDKKGYLRVSLTEGCKNKKVLIHRLICLAFLPNPHNNPYINHINGVKTDIRIENLEWCTPKENVRHAFDTGLLIGTSTGRFGYEANGSIEVHQYTREGEFIKSFGSFKEAGRAVNVNYKCISLCAQGKQKTSAGFLWKLTKQSKAA